LQLITSENTKIILTLDFLLIVHLAFTNCRTIAWTVDSVGKFVADIHVIDISFIIGGIPSMTDGRELSQVIKVITTHCSAKLAIANHKQVMFPFKDSQTFVHLNKLGFTRLRCSIWITLKMISVAASFSPSHLVPFQILELQVLAIKVE